MFIFCHLKLGITLAIPASNELKIVQKTRQQGLNGLSGWYALREIELWLQVGQSLSGLEFR